MDTKIVPPCMTSSHVQRDGQLNVHANTATGTSKANAHHTPAFAAMVPSPSHLVMHSSPLPVTASPEITNSTSEKHLRKLMNATCRWTPPGTSLTGRHMACASPLIQNPSNWHSLSSCTNAPRWAPISQVELPAAPALYLMRYTTTYANVHKMRPMHYV